MASNLDYLDPALIPLEEKVKAFLEAEKALRRVTDSLKNTPPAGQDGGELLKSAANKRNELSQLEQEIIALLPTRDEWLKVNLGYGPSRVGAWHVPASNGTPDRYELRVVH